MLFIQTHTFLQVWFKIKKSKNVDINGTYGDLDSYKLKYNLGHCNVVSYDVCSSPLSLITQLAQA